MTPITYRFVLVYKWHQHNSKTYWDMLISCLLCQLFEHRLHTRTVRAFECKFLQLIWSVCYMFSLSRRRCQLVDMCRPMEEAPRPQVLTVPGSPRKGGNNAILCLASLPKVAQGPQPCIARTPLQVSDGPEWRWVLRKLMTKDSRW